MKIVGLYIPKGADADEANLALIESDDWEHANNMLALHGEEIGRRRDREMVYVLSFNIDAIENITND